MNPQLRRLVLLLAVLVVPSGGHELRSPVSSLLEDTNAYVCPPAVSGYVEHDGLAGTYTEYPGPIGYGAGDWRYYSGHGYVSFQLDQVPDSCTVLSARLVYYQYEHVSGNPCTDVVTVSDFSGSAQQLFQRIGSGTEVSGTSVTPDGWITREFYQTGVGVVDSCRKRHETVYLGIRGGTNPYGAAYGRGQYSPWRAYLMITYSTSAGYVDVVAVEAALEHLPCTVGESLLLRERFTNTGNRTASGFPIITSGNWGVCETLLVDSLMPGETLGVRAALAPVSQPGSVSLTTCSDIPCDWCTHNDTAVTTTYVYPAGTRSVECFELEGTPTFPPSSWLVCNGGDTNTWYRAGPGDRYAHSGEYYARCARTDQTNDWLITHGLAPDAGTPDTVGAFFSAPYSWCYPQVWALGSQDPYDVIGLLLDTTITTQGWCEKHISLDQFDGRIVYVGFRNCAIAGGPLCIDDVWFTSERVTAVEKPTEGPASDLRLSFGQNPVAGGRVGIRYQTSSPGPLLVDVADALGRHVARQRLPLVPRSGQLSLAADDWPAGVYFVTATIGSAKGSGKCVVCRGRP